MKKAVLNAYIISAHRRTAWLKFYVYCYLPLFLAAYLLIITGDFSRTFWGTEAIFDAGQFLLRSALALLLVVSTISAFIGAHRLSARGYALLLINLFYIAIYETLDMIISSQDSPFQFTRGVIVFVVNAIWLLPNLIYLIKRRALFGFAAPEDGMHNAGVPDRRERLSPLEVPEASIKPRGRPSCPACGVPLREQDAFCGSCGAEIIAATPLLSEEISGFDPVPEHSPGVPADAAAEPGTGSNQCPACGEPLEADDAFCINCGAKVCRAESIVGANRR